MPLIGSKPEIGHQFKAAPLQGVMCVPNSGAVFPHLNAVLCKNSEEKQPFFFRKITAVTNSQRSASFATHTLKYLASAQSRW